MGADSQRSRHNFVQSYFVHVHNAFSYFLCNCLRQLYSLFLATPVLLTYGLAQ